MRTNQAGIDLIKTWEGLRLAAYKDPVGIVTIGYGHVGGYQMGDTITPDRAEELLRQDLAKFESAVASLVKVSLNENQFSALVSLCYNIGAGAFAESTLVRKLNGGTYQAAANEFDRWVFGNPGQKLPGLVARREAEKRLFLAPVTSPAPQPTQSPSEPAGATGGASLGASPGASPSAISPAPTTSRATPTTWLYICPPDNWKGAVPFPGEALDAMKAAHDRNKIPRKVVPEQRKFYAGEVKTTPIVADTAIQGNNTLSEHFTVAEFGCNDGTPVPASLLPNAKKVAFILEQIRAIVGHPLTINSAYRTVTHNAKIGGEPNSQHLEAKAADIWCPHLLASYGGKVMVDKLVAAARQVPGVKGLGIYYGQEFIHVDVREGSSRVEWQG